MTWKYDPTISSAEYLALARDRQRQWGAHAWWFDCDLGNPEVQSLGVIPEHVEALFNPESWAPNVREHNRKPRIFIHAYFNRRKNLVVCWTKWPKGIFFPRDFDHFFLGAALRDARGRHRPLGDLMWEPRVSSFLLNVQKHSCPISTAMLFAYKAKLDELVARLSGHLDVVGATTLEFQYSSKKVVGMNLKPTISGYDLKVLEELSKAEMETALADMFPQVGLRLMMSRKTTLH